MLRHLVKACPHFENSTKRQDAERELESRTRKTKRGPVSNSTEIPCNPPLAPLQIPNAMLPSSHLPTPIASGACTPLPGLSGINTLVTFDTPIFTPGPSVPPMLPLLQVDGVDMGPQAKRPRLDSSASSGEGTSSTPFFAEVAAPPKLRWSNELQEQFRAELCMLLIATNTAWWAVDHPYVHWWFSHWLPGAQIPGRKLISGGILDDLARNVENEMKMKVGEKFGTGQCDGWKNIAKTSLIASMINVEYVPWLLESRYRLEKARECRNLSRRSWNVDGLY
ncbi:hypothetical protein QCA50_018048 [Cerrena zonata]|uniref:Uncharacterized protein n=1 Tax=Cerrena zonata TaxID=2478898 RepID=A0AAW0FBT4_9APHY